jgi:ATP-dependent Clp protease ATP-binding subunit ClpA
MFLGPSGVGKTETAKQLSRIYFNNPKSLIRVDMSEFSESFSISKLIGSPAGYVGYRDSNRFTDLVRTNPYSVVLLDEIEKAHPEIFNLLLQILDEGQLMDSTGRAVNFRNTIICMTSNIGLSAFNKAANIGFSASDASEIQETESEVHEQLKSHFRPEFLNRVDKTIIYKPLTQVAYNTIVGLYLNELNTRLIDENIEVVMSPDAQNHVVTKGYGAETGARGVRRFFQDNIEGEIAQLLLAKDTLLKQTIKVETEKEKLVFSAE